MRQSLWFRWLLLLSMLIPFACSLIAAEITTTPAVAQTTTSAQVKASNPGDVPITAAMATRAILILILFVVLAASIAMRRIPAMIALPVLALGIGLIGGIPLMGSEGILATILEGKTPPKSASPAGSFQLYKAIIYVLLGGMFARFIADAGIAERVIKYTAEFGGEDPFFVALLMSAVTALIFTAVGGLPVIIMLGTVMFPVLLSLGVPAPVCGGMLLLAFPIGTSLSPGGWAATAEMYGVSLDVSRSWFLIWAGVQTVVLLVFLAIEFLRMKRTTVTASSVARSIGWIVVGVLFIGAIAFGDRILVSISPGMREPARQYAAVRSYLGTGIRWTIVAVLVIAVLHAQLVYWVGKRADTYWNMLTPILPLVFLLVLGFGDAIVPAFLASLAFGFFTTPRERGMQRLGKSIIDGIADIAAPVVLMLGIGMLIAAAMHPTVNQILTPILARVIPTSPVPYVIFFLIASPLALYRGPLNSWGLGAGLARLMSSIPGMSPGATMGAIQSVGMLQDPTTTQNIWICGYLKLNINALLYKLFFYSVAMVIIGLVIAAVRFF